MSFTPKSNNVTMKFQDINVDQITIESVKMGKDNVPLIRYGPRNETLYVQGPWIKMSQYGVPPGEYLSNGAKNEFYNGPDSRLSVRFPIDKRCCIQTKPENKAENTPAKTNVEEIEAFIIFLKALDAHIKNTPHFMTVAGIDEDEKEKYVSIYRKPAKSKKADAKEKFYSMKVKLDTDGLKDEEKKIKTEVHQFEENPREAALLNVDRYISLEDFDKAVSFNSEVLPIFQLVKVWTQSKGDWGITLKLKKIRVKTISYAEQVAPDFVDSDEEVAVVSKQIKEIKVEAKPEAKPKATVKVSSKGVVEVESSEDESEVIQSKKPTKTIASAPVKAAAVESESESGSGSESGSESESEEEVKPAKKAPAPVVAKKVVAAKTTKAPKASA